MDSEIIMEYQHKEKKIYINTGMKKKIRNKIQYYKIYKNVQDSIL